MVRAERTSLPVAPSRMRSARLGQRPKRPPRPGRLPWKRLISGLLALLGLGLVVTFSVSSIRAQHALDSAPICSNGVTHPDCRQRTATTVTSVRVGTTRDGAFEDIDTRDFGQIDLSDAGARTIRVHTGDQMIVEVWRGQPIAVDASGSSFSTLAAPSNAGIGWADACLRFGPAGPFPPAVG